MVRKYQPKRPIIHLSADETKLVFDRMKTNHISLRKAALPGLSKSTLYRLSKKLKNTNHPTLEDFERPIHNQQIFTPQQETELALYLIHAQKLNHGLTPRKTKKLAFMYGEANEIEMPSNWHKKESAGRDWFTAFLKRNRNLSIRKPERTSQARAAAVNHPVIDKYFDKLLDLLTKYNFQPSEIFNCDETSNPTVLNPPKVVAAAGTRQVSGKTSYEQGNTVTMLCFVNAAGGRFGGSFIYPVKKVNLKKMINLPVGFIPLATSSGWMTADLFLISLKHLFSQVHCTPEKPILLILDNHISHISWQVVEYCKEVGIILFTLPPHTSHVTQPLDRGLYGPMKGDARQEHSDWMRLNPGQRVTTYIVPLLTKGPYLRRFTELNIKASFAACGIWPFNRHAIPEEYFFASKVTELPLDIPQPLAPPSSPQTVSTSTFPQEQLLREAILRQFNTAGNLIAAMRSPQPPSSTPAAVLFQYVLSIDSTGIATLIPMLLSANSGATAKTTIDVGSQMPNAPPTAAIQIQETPTSSTAFNNSHLEDVDYTDSHSTVHWSQTTTSSNEEDGPLDEVILPTVAQTVTPCSSAISSYCYSHQHSTLNSSMTVTTPSQHHLFSNVAVSPSAVQEMNPSSSNENRVQPFLANVDTQLQSTPLLPRRAAVPRRHVSPEEVFPHPQVSQSGPRVARGKNLGKSRVLTDDDEMAVLKESHDLKVAKEGKRVLKENYKANALKDNKRLTKENSQLQKKIQQKETVDVSSRNTKRKSNQKDNQMNKENDCGSMSTAAGRNVQGRRKRKSHEHSSGDLDSQDAYVPSHSESTAPAAQRERISRAVKKKII